MKIHAVDDKAISRFAQAPQAKRPRSTFDRTHGVKTTIGFGPIYPILLDEILPGDTFKVSLTAFARLQTPLVPVMDNMFLDFHFFFVPCRLVWDNWEALMGDNENPLGGVAPVVATVPVLGTGYIANQGSLGDYFGLPTGVTFVSTPLSALPFRCYGEIWNQWYRDENLQNPVVVSTANGPDITTNTGLLYRNKRRDYFTSALPWPQKGNPVSIGLGTAAPITSTGTAIQFTNAGGFNMYLATTSGSTAVTTSATPTSSGNLTFGTANAVVNSLQADLSGATAVTINALRQAFQVQRMLERDARGGTRYVEILLSHFGVVSPDARLQRPEFLGGGTVPIGVTPIAQSSGSGTYSSTPQGNLAGVGTASVRGVGFVKSFVEHGYLLGLVSARADLNYWQGLNRLWIRQTRYDFFWPELAHIGEQPVYQGELYASGTLATDEIVFGYQEVYAEYRYKPSLVTSGMRPNATPNFDQWHLAQDFGSAPTLATAFIQENPPISRVLAGGTNVNQHQQLLFDAYIRQHCTRVMPVYGVPGYIDHF